MDVKRIFIQWPFRRKLQLLLLVIFLPALGIIVATGISQRQHAIVKARDDALLLVRSLVAQQEQIAIATKTMLSTLAQLPQVQNLDAPACNRIFAELHHLYPFYASILAMTPDGYVFAAHSPLEPGKVNQSDRKYFQDAISSRDFSVGEYIIGRVSKTNSLNYSFPVLNVNKKLVAILTAGLNLHKFSNFISMANLPAGSAVVFMDHRGLRLYRSPENEATPIGKPVLKGYFDLTSGRAAEGLFEWTAADGIARINAFKQLRLRENAPPYMYMVVGLPKDKILHEANLNMLRNLLILGFAALLALSLAWILANVVFIKPINRLVTATQQFGQGDMDTRTGLPHTPDELGCLAQAFDDMASALETKNFERERAEEALNKAYTEMDERVQERTVALRGEITERQQVEQTLLQSQQQLKSIFRVAPVGIGLVYTRVIQEANETLCRMTGYSREELVGQNARLLYPTEEEYESVGREKYRQIAERGTGTVETLWKRKDGNIINLLLSSTALDAADLSKGVTFTALDITERKRAEEASAKNYRELQETSQRLEYSRNMLQLIIESVPVRVFWKDSGLRYLGCNTLFAHDAGFSQSEQLLGKDDFAMGWREQADLYGTDDRQVMESRRPKLNIVEPQTTPAGAKIWLNTSKVPLQMPNGEVFGVLGVYEDITARKQAEETLRQSEEKYRLVFEKAPLGILHFDQTSTSTDCNEKFEEIIGAPKEQIIGINMMQQLNDDKLLEAVAASLRGEVGYYEGDYLSITAGKLTPVRGIFQPLFSSDGVVSGGVGIVEDISERKQAEQERLQFSKLESLATLAGGIAHDFNNILTAILGNIGLAMLDGNIEPQVQERLAQAEQACLRAQALSRQLLTFAKGGAPIKKVLSIANLLRESANLTLSGSTSRYEMSIPQDLWSVEADAGQINQVISNLLINADQAMPEGGIIKITAENILVKAESNLPLSEGKYVKFAIADQGIGISPNYLGKIFDPYFSTKQKGSGLGLATAYSIIKNHSGHIQVESQIGVGTTFHIYLPATDKGVPAVESITVKPAMGQGKVLIMDDEKMVREILGKILSRLGYEADSASDGSQAIEKFAKAKESGRPFAAVILDLTVPGGMGGKEAIKELLKIDTQVKAIVSSGYSEDPIMADFQKYGFSEVIAKPYRVSELSKILQRVISKKGD